MNNENRDLLTEVRALLGEMKPIWEALMEANGQDVVARECCNVYLSYLWGLLVDQKD